ncbi:probable serine/threonine-protein kinase At1g54610 isoform X1 [Zingiber officinale]|uniref:probable serine/threonine-protein kinase At1g54610 isoform X1 n=1 Tax=Zingiber officinale TaxID=94328 RepID=UPI001C4CC2E9|nr:probable serine/threonine-protein kinase At1g54610 isoform X1 [Zingiber officinale]XP_042385582.1 probable serine/threonine-protein kinase At1g54610 isoform X1 [Zingiber officinale]
MRRIRKFLMGCVSSKGFKGDDVPEFQRPKASRRTLSRLLSSTTEDSLNRLVSSSRRDEVEVIDVDATVATDGSTAQLISMSQENVAISSAPLVGSGERKVLPVVEKNGRVLNPSVDDGERKVSPTVSTSKGVGLQRQAALDAQESMAEPSSAVSSSKTVDEYKTVISHVSNGFKFEHAAAGWPSWLTAAAGDAVKGWLPRRADSFEKLNKIGQGTYSTVYKACDLETGKTVALKKVRFANMDPESVRFMAREIHILRKLDHPNVVKLEALITSKISSSLYLVFEYMEHDLAGLLGTPGIKFTEPQAKCYMQQLLCGLEHCHNHGVLHRDIKGSNLLIDNNGILKIADFGLATFYNPGQKQHLTSRVVTLWYRPPELLLGATEYGVAVDMWSAGCILAELLSGRPIMPGRTEVEQLHKIFKLCGSPAEEFWRTSKLPHATSFKPQQPYPRCIQETFKDFPPPALALLDCLLSIDPLFRGTAISALKSDFFSTKPFACDPSSLPKYPPSKEYDAKLRNEEARSRQREAAIKEYGSRKEMPSHDGNIESQKLHGSLRTSSDKYKPKDDVLSGFRIDHPRGTAQNGFPHGGLLMHSGRLSTTELPTGQEIKTHASYIPQGGGNALTTGLLVARSHTAKLDRRQSARHAHLPENHLASKYSHPESDSSEKPEWTHHLLDGPSSSRKNDDKTGEEEQTTGHAPRKNRIHYSGPLMPPRGNIDEILKEHERQIQQAVRRARHNRTKPRKYGERAQFEALLYASRNGN